MPADDPARARVETFLAKARAAVSEGDVVAGTGLDVGTVKRALYDLMRTHVSSIDVREDGTLVYDFGPTLTPLGAKTWRDHLASLGGWLWKGFTFAYKASLAVVLVVYAVVFVALILAAAIAASVAAEDEGPAEGAFHLLGAVFRGIFEFATHTAITYDAVDAYGYHYAHYEPRGPVLPQRKKKEHAKGFIASVYDFVFGPERAVPDERAQQREIASFVRRNRGILTIADVQALSGKSREEAGHLFAQAVAELGGEAEVTDDGALYARFEELLRSKTTKHDEPIVMYWDEYEPPHELTGNTAGKNIGITLLAAFNLLCSVFFLSSPDLFGSGTVWLGAIPATVFGLFFAIPLVRGPVVWWRNKRRHAENIRKRLFKAIFGEKGEKLAFRDVVARANRDAKSEERLNAEKLKDLLEETLRQVGGELDTDTRKGLVMNLRQLRAEESASVENAIKEEAAEVVYSTR